MPPLKFVVGDRENKPHVKVRVDPPRRRDVLAILLGRYLPSAQLDWLPRRD